jgi:hypothetical protein
MKIFKIFDAIVVGMFIFGLAFALSNQISNQNAPLANNIIEVSPDHNHSLNPVS